MDAKAIATTIIIVNLATLAKVIGSIVIALEFWHRVPTSDWHASTVTSVLAITIGLKPYWSKSTEFIITAIVALNATTNGNDDAADSEQPKSIVTRYDATNAANDHDDAEHDD